MNLNNQKPKTRQQIAEEYGISRRTLLRWLVKAKVKLPRGLVRYADQIKVYRVLEKYKSKVGK